MDEISKPDALVSLTFSQRCTCMHAFCIHANFCSLFSFAMNFNIFYFSFYNNVLTSYMLNINVALHYRRQKVTVISEQNRKSPHYLINDCF